MGSSLWRCLIRTSVALVHYALVLLCGGAIGLGLGRNSARACERSAVCSGWAFAANLRVNRSRVRRDARSAMASPTRRIDALRPGIDYRVIA